VSAVSCRAASTPVGSAAHQAHARHLDARWSRSLRPEPFGCSRLTRRFPRLSKSLPIQLITHWQRQYVNMANMTKARLRRFDRRSDPFTPVQSSCEPADAACDVHAPGPSGLPGHASPARELKVEA
jgi:hypothetical protein